MSAPANRQASACESTRTKALFVNSGILGMRSFSKYIREAMALDPEIEATHIDLSENLTLDERILRRALCVRVCSDTRWGVKNLDLARFRHEYHAGLQARRRIRRVLARDRIDVLHFHRQATAYASLDLMRRIPSVVSIDSTPDIMIEASASALERWTYTPNVAFDGRILRAAAAVVSTSEWAASAVRRRYPDCRAPIHVMPSPVRLQYFNDRWPEERLSRVAQDPGYRPHVLFVGGDFARKGGEDLLAVWQAEEMHRHAQLDLVTDAPVSVDGIPGVRLVRGVGSYSAEWSDLWHRADIFVLPTRHEAFGQVYQEAAAAGLPRIGTRINAIPEMIADGETGLLIPLGDRGALAHALRRLLESPALRRDLGQAARAHVVKHASPDEYHQKLRRVIHEAAARPPQRGQPA